MLIWMIVIAIIGVLVGTQINRAIYAWTYGEVRRISPWGPPHKDAPPIGWLARFPIVGWLTRRSESEIHGKGFWVRPSLIELGCLIGFPFLFWWIASGYLVEPSVRSAVTDSMVHVWFWSFAILIGLMTIATFIDFDEKTIPDEVTIPGTLIALVIAWICPTIALPTTDTFVRPGPQMSAVRFDFPQQDPFALVAANGQQRQRQPGAPPKIIKGGQQQDPPKWSLSTAGLWLSLGIVVVWSLALMPKLVDYRYGVANGIRFMVASIIRPARKTKPKRKFKVADRSMFTITKVLFGMMVVICILIVVAWAQRGSSPMRWYSLFSALLGMGFGGATVWSVRLLGTFALRKEAMGFGDVTLLAMIGAFLGWQAAGLTFVMAPFAAVFIAVTQFILTRRHELAFGPYLCLAACSLVMGWQWIWNGFAAPYVFMMGSMLLWVLVIALVMLYVMLTFWRFIAYRD